MNRVSLREQSAVLTSINPNTTDLYSDSNNFVIAIASGGAPRAVGAIVTGFQAQAIVSTGMGVVNTGVWFGRVAGGSPITGLAAPTQWAHIFGSDGSMYAIPLYATS